MLSTDGSYSLQACSLVRQLCAHTDNISNCNNNNHNDRSLGDTVAHSIGVTHEPDVVQRQLQPGLDRILILASDGIWDMLSNEVSTANIPSLR
jgi:serine/threonine protein phosphatase PrpC